MKKVRVCCGRSCTTFGSKGIMRDLEKETGLQAGEKNESFDIDYCDCLGWCSNAPNAEVDDSRILFEVEPGTIMDRIEQGGKRREDIVQHIDIDELLEL